jgi:hypothetical protein
VVINILFLIFAPMVLFDKGSVPAERFEAQPERPSEISVPGKNEKPIPSATRTVPVTANRQADGTEKSTSETAAGADSMKNIVSENPLEKDAMRILADATETNRLLAEQLVKQGGGVTNAGLDSRNGGEENAG